METAQTARNVAGRERLRDGILADAAGVDDLSDGVGLDALDYLVVPDFLSPDACAALADFARGQDFTKNHKDIADDYWKSRLLFYSDVLAQRPDLAAMMQAANRASIDRMTAFYGLAAPIFTDTLQLVRWSEGMHMMPHADRANPDGSPHRFAYRDFASIVYLNDDYDGGEIYFTALGQVMKPRAGMLVAFTGGWRHEHAVLKVREGTRFTMPAFYSFDPARRDHVLYDARPD
jgi:predicted 2-oxoglutarate/Fe(II)-dependent dioxygenase YbiX